MSNYRHGLIKTSEYRSWNAMKSRCYDKNNNRYRHYGARGIKVCDKWLNDFAAFYEDVGPKPSKSHSLERLDVSGDYCPENCVWASMRSQQNNRRNNRLVKHNGQEKTIAQWSRETGIDRSLLSWRIRVGWSPERALSEKPRRKS